MRTILTICLLLLACTAMGQYATPAPPDGSRDRKIAHKVKTYMKNRYGGKIDSVSVLITKMAARKQLYQTMAMMEELPQTRRDSITMLIPTTDSIKQEYYFALLAVQFRLPDGQQDAEMVYAFLTKDLVLIIATPLPKKKE